MREKNSSKQRSEATDQTAPPSPSRCSTYHGGNLTEEYHPRGGAHEPLQQRNGEGGDEVTELGKPEGDAREAGEECQHRGAGE